LACPDQAGDSRVAKVYFATDRKAAPEEKLGFSKSRSTPPTLRFGRENVVLGRQHRLGKVDEAVKVQAGGEVVRSSSEETGEALERSDESIRRFVDTKIRTALRSSPPPRQGGKKQVLVFVHGYNTNFEYAIRKTAQLAGDLELVTCEGDARGVSIAYSWPAQGTLLSYFADEENAEWTQERLTPFLRSLARLCRQEDTELQLIAHSLGARALIRSLADLALMRRGPAESGELFDQVILLAPDIGRGLFEQYSERMLPLVGHLTIYVSGSDRALGISRFLHGGSGRLGLLEGSLRAALRFVGATGEDYETLGEAPTRLLGPKVDMIDVTGGLAGGLGHIYEDPEFINDLKELIYNSTPAGKGMRSNLVQKDSGRPLIGGAAGETLQYFQLRPN
jgi:esterase/lipase superfamily enzyme